MLDYDETGSIGKRYRREDEIGTPYCITVDFATVGDEKTPADNAVTIRDRDTMEQVRVPIAELKSLARRAYKVLSSKKAGHCPAVPCRGRCPHRPVPAAADKASLV